MRKSFSAKREAATNADFQRKLKMFSVSDHDAMLREAAIVRAINNTIDLTDYVMRKRGQFAGGASVSSANLDGSMIYSSIMRSYVSSFIPIFAVSRDMDAPKQQLMYTDFYDLLDQQLIVPNIGPDRAWVEKVWDGTHGANPVTETLNPATPLTITAGTPILPRSFKAIIKKDNVVKGEIYDNGQGGYFATPGILASTGSNIIYNSGTSSTVHLVFETGLDANKIEYTCIFDQTADDKVNRAFGKNDYYNMQTEPLLVPVERDVISDHAMAKQGIINTDELYANFIETEYTKAINNKIVRTLTSNYTGDSYRADLSHFSLAAGQAEALSRTVKHVFAQAENILAEQTYKEAKVTGILAGHKSVDLLNFLTPDQGWVKNNNRGYYKDIVGWLDGAPVVLANQGIAEDEVMLTSRTEDGQIAPIFHGIFLAPTDLPVVANYAQITQYTSGLYSMEGFGYTTSKLCTKIKFTVPSDLQVVRI